MLRSSALRRALPSVLALFVASTALSQATAPRENNSQQNNSQEKKQKEVRPAGIWYGIEKARPKKTGALRLACYNAENLFDDFDDPTLSGEYDDIKETTTAVRCRGIADAIRRLDADVLCLEEIESKRCLEWFNETYLKDMGYRYIASEDVGYYRGVEQSVLSRVPIESVTIYTGDDARIDDMKALQTDDAAKRLGGKWSEPQSGEDPKVFQRSPLRVDLKTDDGYALTVFVVHFKAGRFDHQRELEALQTEQFVEEILQKDPDANVAVLGDYNGTPNDMNVKVLRQSDGGLVSAYDWRFDKKAPRDAYTTHASGRAIDFIVMSPGLAADCVDGSYFVLGTLHAASDWDFRKADEIPPPEGYASDHYPVAIDFLPKPDRKASEFKRSSSSDEDRRDGGSSGAPSAGASKAGARSDVRSDATAPTAADLAQHAKPDGTPTAADTRAADALRAAGWEFLVPYPKSKAAKWSSKGGNTTWWPGYWRNAKSGETSRAQPAGATLKGDGKPAPSGSDYAKTGAPGRVTWVEWLCAPEAAGH